LYGFRESSQIFFGDFSRDKWFCFLFEKLSDFAPYPLFHLFLLCMQITSCPYKDLTTTFSAGELFPDLVMLGPIIKLIFTPKDIWIAIHHG
jgi:hypothetical protein